jgi:hypothetical protein
MEEPRNSQYHSRHVSRVRKPCQRAQMTESDGQWCLLGKRDPSRNVPLGVTPLYWYLTLTDEVRGGAVGHAKGTDPAPGYTFPPWRLPSIITTSVESMGPLIDLVVTTAKSCPFKRKVKDLETRSQFSRNELSQWEGDLARETC